MVATRPPVGADMNSDDLAFFSLVVDSGSISAAALANGCDASTLSRRITQLEKSVGTRLFSRSGRGVTLTAQGHELLSYARQVTSLIESARKAASSKNRQGPARIRIAAQPTIAKVLFAALFHAIHDRFPTSQIHFTEGSASKVLTELQAGNIDVAVVYKPEHPGNLTYEPLLFEKLYLLTPTDSDVTPEQVRANGLAGIPLVLPSTPHGQRLLVQAMAARRGYVPNIVLQCDSSIALRLDLVANGCGCTVLPLAAAEADIAAGRLLGFPLEEEGSERCIALVLGKTDIPSTDLWVLNSFIRDLSTHLVKTARWHGARLAS
jgi:LysR family nitrogen assimilation transcriptional regulator